jgi:spore coat polysaccharide biosynthesis protein SpsF
LIDPDVIDRVVRTYRDAHGEFDYVSNLHPPTWPDGNDVEVMSMEALEYAGRIANRPYEREHTTPFLWDDNPMVRTHTVSMERGQNYAMRHRWTVDYPEDYMLVRAVYDGLYQHVPRFGLYEILEYLQRHPEVDAINAHLCGVNWYRHHLSELKTKTTEDTRV